MDSINVYFNLLKVIGGVCITVQLLSQELYEYNVQ